MGSVINMCDYTRKTASSNTNLDTDTFTTMIRLGEEFKLALGVCDDDIPTLLKKP